MKRLVLGLLAGLLVGCGSLNAAPPSTGELLGAPTSLNLAGSAVRAKAAPTVSGETFKVRLKLQASGSRRGALPSLVLTDLYVVSREGVWSAPLGAKRLQPCGAQCALTSVSAPARGMQRGTGVQVVLGLRDAAGRPHLLRGGDTRVK